MKKRGLLVLFLAIILISTASAVEIQLSKENYYPGETLQAEIYGNFLQPLKLENIHFYRDRNIPVVYDILKLSDKYLFYALLPYQTGNYSLKLRDIRYTTATGSSTDDVIKNFQIQQQPSNKTILTIEPGFIVAKKDFSFKVKTNKFTEIKPEFKATGQTKTLSLTQGEKKQISFSIQNIENYTESTITIQDYEIPVIVVPKKSDQEIIEQTGSFRFNPLEIKATILKNQNFSSKVKLMNLGDIDISNISIQKNINLDISISPNNIDLLEQGEQKFINITLSPNEKGNYTGNISAFSENISTILNINVKVSENKSEVEFETPIYTNKTCSEIGGKICLLNETCDNCQDSSDAYCCCIGQCLPTQDEDEEGSGWIYGIIIVVLVLAGLGVLFYFMKKKQKQQPNQEIEKRQKNYEQRMSQQPSKQTKDSLSKT
jgi:hypothetical protein